MQLLDDILWNLATPNRIRRALRRSLHPPKSVFETESPISGKIRVIDRGRERELYIGNTCHSFLFTRGSWDEIEGEYYSHLHRGPYVPTKCRDVLMCGLGGGVALHAMARQLQPKSITVIELDPAIVDVARRYFMLDSLNVEILPGAAAERVAALGRSGRLFDLVIEDAELLPVHANQGLALDRFAGLAAILGAGGSVAMNAPYFDKEGRGRIDAFMEQLLRRNFEIDQMLIHSRWATNCVLYSRRSRIPNK